VKISVPGLGRYLARDVGTRESPQKFTTPDRTEAPFQGCVLQST